MLSGVQRFQALSVQDKGYIVAVAGPCGDACELGRHAGILLSHAVLAVRPQPSLFLQTPCGAQGIEGTLLLECLSCGRSDPPWRSTHNAWSHGL